MDELAGASLRGANGERAASSIRQDNLAGEFTQDEHFAGEFTQDGHDGMIGTFYIKQTNSLRLRLVK